MLGIIKSFNPKVYKELAKQKVIKSFAFLSLLAVLVSAGLSWGYANYAKKLLPGINSWLRDNLAQISFDLPDIEIKDGLLIQPKEYYAKQWGDKFSFVIEPSQKKVFLLLEDYDNAIVLTETRLIVKNTKPDSKEFQIKTYELKEIKSMKFSAIEKGVRVSVVDNSFDVTPDSIDKFFRKLSKILYPFIFIWIGILYFFTKVVQVLFFSVFSFIVNKNLKKPLTYKNLINIGIYALTAPTALALIKELLNLKIPLFGLIYISIYVIYLFLGIKHCDFAENTQNLEIKQEINE